VEVCSGELEVGISEVGVAEAVAESVEGFAFEIAVSSVGHGVVLEGGELVESGVEGDGKTAAGLLVPARVSAMACEPPSPGYQASRMASAFCWPR